MFNSLIIAFAMYSKIPMPRVDWSDKNMRYVMAFFPAVGAVIGLFEYLLYRLTVMAGFGQLMRAALLALLPVLISGGIHLDGFMDTMDARSSWGDRDKKLEILKDSHTGAFAILSCCSWFLIWTAAWSEVSWRQILSAAFCFPFARILSGLSVTIFQCAKNSGLAATFHNAAHKQAVRRVLLLELVICAVWMILADPIYGCGMILTALAVFASYRRFSYRDFGGITGDLAGYFLCMCELAQVMVVVILGIWH